MDKKCETCIKRKTMYCPNSIKCMATDDKPYYRNKIMLLEENQELKKQLKDKTEDYRRMKDNFDSKVDVLTKIATQQKEFIKFLEDNWNTTQDIWYIKILQKYKEIIGVPMARLDDEEEPDLFEIIEDMKNKPKYIEEIKLVEIQNLWDRDIEIEKKLKEITKAVNYLLDKDKK